MDTVARLNQLLDSKGISVYQLAKISGVNYSTLKSTVARNGQLSLDTIERICEALHLPLEEYFRAQPSVKAPPLTDEELTLLRSMMSAYERRSTAPGR